MVLPTLQYIANPTVLGNTEISHLAKIKSIVAHFELDLLVLATPDFCSTSDYIPSFAFSGHDSCYISVTVTLLARNEKSRQPHPARPLWKAARVSHQGMKREAPGSSFLGFKLTCSVTRKWITLPYSTSLVPGTHSFAEPLALQIPIPQ